MQLDKRLTGQYASVWFKWGKKKTQNISRQEASRVLHCFPIQNLFSGIKRKSGVDSSSEAFTINLIVLCVVFMHNVFLFMAKYPTSQS